MPSIRFSPPLLSSSTIRIKSSAFRSNLHFNYQHPTQFHSHSHSPIYQLNVVSHPRQKCSTTNSLLHSVSTPLSSAASSHFKSISTIGTSVAFKLPGTHQSVFKLQRFNSASSSFASDSSSSSSSISSSSSSSSPCPSTLPPSHLYRPSPLPPLPDDPGVYSVDNPPPMTIQRIVFLILPIGIGSGVLGALAGVGGAVVLVPLLTSIAGYKQAQASATGVLCSAVTALSGSFTYAYNGCVCWPAAIVITICASATVGIGARMATKMNEKTLQFIVAAVMILLAPLVMFKAMQKDKTTIGDQVQVPTIAQKDSISSTSSSPFASTSSSKPSSTASARPVSPLDTPSLYPYSLLAAGGGSLGLINGSIGFGGAITIASVLNLTQDYHHLSFATISGTILASLIIPSSVGAYHHYKLGNVIRISRLPFLLSGVGIGALIGAELAVVLPEKYPQIMFALFLAGNGARQLVMRLRSGVVARAAAAKANAEATAAAASVSRTPMSTTQAISTTPAAPTSASISTPTSTSASSMAPPPSTSAVRTVV